MEDSQNMLKKEDGCECNPLNGTEKATASGSASRHEPSGAEEEAQKSQKEGLDDSWIFVEDLEREINAVDTEMRGALSEQASKALWQYLEASTDFKKAFGESDEAMCQWWKFLEPIHKAESDLQKACCISTEAVRRSKKALEIPKRVMKATREMYAQRALRALEMTDKAILESTELLRKVSIAEHEAAEKSKEAAEAAREALQKSNVVLERAEKAFRDMQEYRPEIDSCPTEVRTVMKDFFQTRQTRSQVIQKAPQLSGSRPRVPDAPPEYWPDWLRSIDSEEHPIYADLKRSRAERQEEDEEWEWERQAEANAALKIQEAKANAQEDTWRSLLWNTKEPKRSFMESYKIFLDQKRRFWRFGEKGRVPPDIQWPAGVGYEPHFPRDWTLIKDGGPTGSGGRIRQLPPSFSNFSEVLQLMIINRATGQYI